MVRKGYFYMAKPVAPGLKKSYPASKIRKPTIVRALEYAPVGSLDVIDIQFSSGRKDVMYSFQLGSRPVKRPRNWRGK